MLLLPSPTTASRSWIASLLLLPLSILLFAVGFFPYKPFIPGLATLRDDERDAAPAKFDKVVFMVVDALRSDFVYANGSGFTFTQELIRTGAARPFTAHAGPPTITMPRIKAMTTGSVPSFVDVILNFAESDTSSTLAQQDTWLAQLKALRGRGPGGEGEGRLAMYGDDTWLKLFPGDFFAEKDGTTSFFVADFEEVDRNVTRHVGGEMWEGRWDGVVLHFLGLDHIGHKAGPGSPHMLPKQREMDAVIHTIYSAITTHPHLSNTLFVLAGDHGMNDGGNHGGSSPGETSPALVFISPKLRSLPAQGHGQGLGADSPLPPRADFQFYETVEQIDIAPTIAGLMGLPVPLNSLGVFIPSLLPLWETNEQRVAVMLRNARQLRNVVATKFLGTDFDADVDASCVGVGVDADDAARLACLYSLATSALSQSDDASASNALTSLLTFSRAAQDVMSSLASNYNMQYLYLAIILAATSTFLAGVSALRELRRDSSWQAPWATVYVLAVTGGYAGMMFASSYVEEEQVFWHWVLSAWEGYLLVKWLRSPAPKSTWRIIYMVATLLGIPRVVRRWNQTGQKHSGAPDIVDVLALHPLILWLLNGWTYVGVAFRCTRALTEQAERTQVTKRAILTWFVVLATVTASLFFKMSFTAAQAPEMMPEFIDEEVRDGVIGMVEWFVGMSLVAQCRAAFVLMGIVMVLGWFSSGSRFEKSEDRRSFVLTDSSSPAPALVREMVTLFLMTQSRAENIFLFTLYETQLAALGQLQMSQLERSVTGIVQQYTSFFAFGGSNSIASIDLSSAYNGVSRYDVFAVGLLTFVGNWAGPVWWVVAMSKGQGRGRRLAVMGMFVGCSVVAVMGACTALRTHLFIWSVFSPKYLYAMAWTLGHYVGANVVLGGIM